MFSNPCLMKYLKINTCKGTFLYIYFELFDLFFNNQPVCKFENIKKIQKLNTNMKYFWRKIFQTSSKIVQTDRQILTKRLKQSNNKATNEQPKATILDFNIFYFFFFLFHFWKTILFWHTIHPSMGYKLKKENYNNETTAASQQQKFTILKYSTTTRSHTQPWMSIWTSLKINFFF